MPQPAIPEDRIRQLLRQDGSGRYQEALDTWDDPLPTEVAADTPPGEDPVLGVPIGGGKPAPAPEPSAPFVPFDKTLPSLAEVNAKVYQTDSPMAFGPRGLSMNPPPAGPQLGSRASIAAAHQRRMGR